MATTNQGLERPTIVQLSAAVLIMTPLLDIFFARKAGFSLFGWVECALILGAGVSLLIRHKLAWLLGIIFCTAFLICTTLLVAESAAEQSPWLNAARVFNVLLVFFIVGSVSYFFRYPYLDRRQRWLAPTANRFQVTTAVVIDDRWQGQTQDLSYTGLKVILHDKNHDIKADQTVEVYLPEVNDIRCQAKVIGINDRELRISFTVLSANEQQRLRQWIQKQNLEKV